MYDSTYAYDLKKLSSYAASQPLPSLVQWKPAETGHVLVAKKTQELFIGVAVVQVFDYKLNCSPSGNFIRPDLGSLEKAKFQFYAGRPADINFGDDFQKLFANLTKLQQDIAVSKDHRDMLYTDASGKMIRFARGVFEKRVCTKLIGKYRTKRRGRLTSLSFFKKEKDTSRLTTPRILRRRGRTQYLIYRHRIYRRRN